jgi:hypothetical protein
VAVARGLGGVAAQDRLELAAQLVDAAFELCAVACVLMDLSCPEQLVADPEACLVEVLFGGEAVGVRGDVALLIWAGAANAWQG